MLKITSKTTESTTTLVLEGKLVDPWIAELEKTWSEIRKVDESRAIVVDLMDVTLVNQRGQELLQRMLMAGTVFNCCRGVHTKHVIQKLLHGFGKHGRNKDVKR